MPATKRTKVICGTVATALLLAGCATTYKPPVTSSISYSTEQEVRDYLTRHIDAYTAAAKEVGGGQDLAGVGTIISALVGTTGLALGAGPALGIVAGSAGAGLNAASNYARPADRLRLLAQALDATRCIQEEYGSQNRRVTTLTPNLAKVDANSPFVRAQEFFTGNAHFRRQVSERGRIAVDAARSISSSLQAKWFSLSTVPDYATTLKQIQDAQAAAAANKPPADTDAGNALLLIETNEFEAKIQSCKAKFPA